jgi:hypothetical protein
VGFDVVLGGVLGMVGCVNMMAMSQVGMVSGFLVVALGVGRGGMVVVARSVLVMLRCLLVMMRCFV